MFRKLLIASILSGLSFSAIAQETGQNEPVDPVRLFNEICYSKVPSVQAIQDMAAQLAWLPIGGEDLKQFTTLENPEKLLGWDVRFSERLFRLGVVQSALDERADEQFPGFSGGQATTCMLILDGQDDGDWVIERMSVLARKEPTSRAVKAEGLPTTIWSGGNDDLKVFLVLKTNDENQASLMSVTLLAKSQ